MLSFRKHHYEIGQTGEKNGQWPEAASFLLLLEQAARSSGGTSSFEQNSRTPFKIPPSQYLNSFQDTILPISEPLSRHPQSQSSHAQFKVILLFLQKTEWLCCWLLESLTNEARLPSYIELCLVLHCTHKPEVIRTSFIDLCPMVDGTLVTSGNCMSSRITSVGTVL